MLWVILFFGVVMFYLLAAMLGDDAAIRQERERYLRLSAAEKAAEDKAADEYDALEISAAVAASRVHKENRQAEKRLALARARTKGSA